MSPDKWLDALGVPHECRSRRTSAEEKRCKIILNVPPGSSVWKVTVDGCWIRDRSRRKVDYLFLVEECADGNALVLAELKGHHIGDAIEQVEQTLTYLVALPAFRDAEIGRLLVYIVPTNGRALPRYEQRLERLRQKFKIKKIRIRGPRCEARPCDE